MLGTLLAELAQGVIPPLPGARCRGREELFDQTIDQNADDDGTALNYARKAAARVCASCPVLDQCASWVDGLPRGQRPRGIVAGRFTDEVGRRWDKGQKLRRDSKRWAQMHNTPGRLSA